MNCRLHEGYFTPFAEIHYDLNDWSDTDSTDSDLSITERLDEFLTILPLGLIEVNRQVRGEMTAFWFRDRLLLEFDNYEKNASVLELKSEAIFKAWKKSLPPAAIKAIREIHIRPWSSRSTPAANALMEGKKKVLKRVNSDQEPALFHAAIDPSRRKLTVRTSYMLIPKEVESVRKYVEDLVKLPTTDVIPDQLLKFAEWISQGVQSPDGARRPKWWLIELDEVEQTEPYPYVIAVAEKSEMARTEEVEDVEQVGSE